MARVTLEIKQKMIKMRQSGLTIKKIAEDLGFRFSTVQYHTNVDQRKKQIERSARNIKPGQTRDRTDYQRKYQSDKYKNDPEFRERAKRLSRESKRRTINAE